MFGIFLDLCKAYAVIDRNCCLLILPDTGIGPKALHILKTFWDRGVLGCRVAR